MKLKKVTIHKYKSFAKAQEFNLEDDVTVLVGMNEAGKTAVLEAIAKTNYFQDDESFKFNPTHDYPRKEVTKIRKSKENPEIVTCTYKIGNNILQQITKELGEGVFNCQEFSITKLYDNSVPTGNVDADKEKFIEHKTQELGILNDKLIQNLKGVQNVTELQKLIDKNKSKEVKSSLSSLKKYFENKKKWANPIAEYIYRKILKPNQPKFLYYDEYYSLPAKISIEKMNEEVEGPEYKTAKALFELADINTEELINSNDFENVVAELEATQANISNTLFKYWRTNKNLSIDFKIQPKEGLDAQRNTHIVEHILNIRVKNKEVSLPLENRSKGFNWFFSFLVWFKKIQEDQQSNYILLLDEPGLNLHASAQADLLYFIEDLTEKYQIIYTTHSPFMISSDKLNRVNTVFEDDSGSIISDSLQEKDPNTLFPLQAALGYDIAQNLFISNKNLLVEGVSDLIILTAISGILEKENRTFLNKDITIVPTGGLEKVATFVSLLRGSKLKIACLLDTPTDKKSEAKLNTLTREKIIKDSRIIFFDNYTKNHKKADLEDLFNKSDYLKLFNSAFSNKYREIKKADLNRDIEKIIIQINKFINEERFNHYLPAKEIIGKEQEFFSGDTLENFEKVFRDINGIFK